MKLSTIVEFDRVGLRYGTGAEVLRDLDFHLSRGGFYFLTGPSGAGKTTLLKLLYLAQRPTRQDPLFEEYSAMPARALPPSAADWGDYQDFRLIRHLSAFDNVALPLRIAGHDGSDGRGTRCAKCWPGSGLRIVKCEPPTLSAASSNASPSPGGDRPTRLLFADEPTGNVDAEMAGRILHLLTRSTGSEPQSSSPPMICR